MRANEAALASSELSYHSPQPVLYWLEWTGIFAVTSPNSQATSGRHRAASQCIPRTRASAAETRRRRAGSFTGTESHTDGCTLFSISIASTSHCYCPCPVTAAASCRASWQVHGGCGGERDLPAGGGAPEVQAGPVAPHKAQQAVCPDHSEPGRRPHRLRAGAPAAGVRPPEAARPEATGNASRLLCRFTFIFATKS